MISQKWLNETPKYIYMNIKRWWYHKNDWMKYEIWVIMVAYVKKLHISEFDDVAGNCWPRSRRGVVFQTLFWNCQNNFMFLEEQMANKWSYCIYKFRNLQVIVKICTIQWDLNAVTMKSCKFRHLRVTAVY